MILENHQEFASPGEALEHHGVKGQRWGFRRSRSRDPLSDAERTAAKTNLKPEIKDVSKRVTTKQFTGERSISTKPYSKLSTERRTIDAGKDLFRVTPRKDEQFRSTTFVSVNEKDRLRYQAVIPSLSGRGGKKSYKQHYEVTLKTTQKLTLPSEKDRIDAFNDILTTQSIHVGGGKTITGQQYLRRLGYGKHVDSVHNSKNGRAAFDGEIAKQYMNTPITSAYFGRLRDKGFNAVQDDNDHKILSNDPLVLLNPNGTVKKAHIRPLTNKDINNAQTLFTVKDV